ncbi:AAA family ATPase [Phocaeicola sartorii]|uniref:AAA family ATPase n=1 Tax=Phocaeicola sartorii TaxID=671267 RepID=UPI00266F0F9F|nr:AAA family ATPase [Phocaeicola sartorii]
MKNIKVHIETLGPVKHATLELGQTLFFTGASNLGKSYVCFLSYYVFSLFANGRLIGFLSDKIKNTEQLAEFSFSIEELTQWMEKDVKLFFAYLLNYPDVPCEVSFDFGEVVESYHVKCNEQNLSDTKIPVGTHIVDVYINEKRHNFISFKNRLLSDLVSIISTTLSADLLGSSINHAYLLPPGRASLLGESFSNQKNSSKIGMYDIFLQDNDLINNKRISTALNKSVETFEKRIYRLLNGVLSPDKEGVALRLDAGNEIPLSAAASSIKELSPLLLWMQTNDVGSDSVCIEEPEAHAHPEMQFAIADLLAACINEGTHFQITTHSDYFLSRINQLMRLGRLKKENSESYEAICQKHHIASDISLDAAKITAYYFYFDAQTQGTKIEKLDLSDGIPFTTFSNIVNRQIDLDADLEEA